MSRIQPSLPAEILELIVDELGRPYIDPDGGDYQCLLLRRTLCNLSFSGSVTLDVCRRYLWHTIVLTRQEPVSIRTLDASRGGFKALYETLVQDDGPARHVRSMVVDLYRMDLSNCCILQHEPLQHEREPDSETWAGAFLTFVPKIMMILRNLESLKLTERQSQCSFTRYGPGGGSLANAICHCIRNNPIKRVEMVRMMLPRSFLLELLASVEQLLLAIVSVDDWDPQPELAAFEASTKSLKHLRLDQYTDCYSVLSTVPATFFKCLTVLEAGLFDDDEPFFQFTYKTLIGNAKNLQELNIEHSGCGGIDFEGREWANKLSLVLDVIPLPSVLKKLSLHFSDVEDHPLSFGRLVDAYLGHRFPQNIGTFHLKISWTNGQSTSAYNDTQGDLLEIVDDRLSDQARFPNLKAMNLVLEEEYYLRYLSEAEKDRNQGQRTQRLNEAKGAFHKTQRRGVGVLVAWDVKYT